MLKRQTHENWAGASFAHTCKKMTFWTLLSRKHFGVLTGLRFCGTVPPQGGHLIFSSRPQTNHFRSTNLSPGCLPRIKYCVSLNYPNPS